MDRPRERGPRHRAAPGFCTLEALNNVAKYARASQAGYGTGLQGLADRPAALGGELTIRSAPGAGTTVPGRLAAEATR